MHFVMRNANGSATQRKALLPVEDGAEFCNFWIDGAPIERNLVRGKPDSLPSPTPPDQADFHVVCANMAKYFDTLFIPGQAKTLIVIAEPVSDVGGNVPLVGNLGGALQSSGVATAGQALFLSQGTAGDNQMSCTYQDYSPNGSGSTAQSVASGNFNPLPQTPPRPYMIAGRTMANGNRRVDVLGTVAVGVNPTTTESAPGQTYRYGSSYSAGTPSACRLYAGWLYGRGLSDAELLLLRLGAQHLFATISDVRIP